MKEYMLEAISLAKKGIGKVNPNPLVGAIVVKDGKIVGRGYHKEYGGPHAEVFAIQEAGALAEGATIYVTLEPCSHYGKTPPCAELLVKSKIKKCVIGIKDPNPLVAGRGIRILEENGIEVEVGLLEEEIKKMNRVFLHYITKKTPFFYLKTAITLDGKIALANGESKWISNEFARNYVQNLRNEFMGIMLGINTVNKDNPSLDARIENGLDPYRIVIDPFLEIKKDSKFLEKSKLDEKSIIITSASEKDKIKEFEEYKVKFICLEDRDFKIANIKEELYKLGIDSVLVEGGRKLISILFKENAIDQGTIFIAPKITGDKNAISLVEGRSIEKLEDSILLKNPKYEIFGDNIALHFGGE